MVLKITLLVSITIIHSTVEGVDIQADLSQVSSELHDWANHNTMAADKLSNSDSLLEFVNFETFLVIPDSGNSTFVADEDLELTDCEKFAEEINNYSLLKKVSPFIGPYTDSISRYRKFNNSFAEIVELSKEISILKESYPHHYKELRQVINETRALMIQTELRGSGDLLMVGRFILDSIYFKVFKPQREKKGELELITNQY